jgi:transposase
MREITSTFPSPAFVGIDVSKHRIDVSVRPLGEHRAVAYDDAALPGLIRRLLELRPALVVLEATGGLQSAAGMPESLRNRAWAAEFGAWRRV